MKCPHGFNVESLGSCWQCRLEEMQNLQSSMIRSLQDRVAELETELARRDTCHVCGDHLVAPDDGRCEKHSMDDPGDVEGEECACMFCVPRP